MRIKTDRVTSVSHYVEWVKDVQDSFRISRGLHEPWFRGVGSSTFHLVPSLYRRADKNDSPRAEKALRREFERRAPQYLGESQGRDAWELYFLMQHYRVPTRLLDWTDSALVALYFAVYSASSETDPTPSVWALNPFELNRLSVSKVAILESDWRLAQPYLSTDTRMTVPPHAKWPAAISPRLFDRRMLAQHSQFTIHGSDAKGIDQMNELSTLARRRFLRKVIIQPIDDLTELRLHMATCGIVHTMVFPDLEGLAEDLKRDFL